jgi:hypothetical protein
MVTVEAFQDPHLEEVGWENNKMDPKLVRR